MTGDWKKQLPNIITMLRVFITPFIVGLLHLENPTAGYIAAGLFCLASVTDYFDGKLARSFQVESLFGKFMDPIADKILVTSTLIMLIPSGRLEAVMVIILLARDTMIGGLRSVAASQNIIIGAGSLGKWKTAIQMGAIPAVLIKTPLFGLPIYEIGYWFLWVSVVLSVISGGHYLFNYLKKT